MNRVAVLQRLARLESAAAASRPSHVLQAVVRQGVDEHAHARRQFDAQRADLLASGRAAPRDEFHELTLRIVPSPTRSPAP